MSFILLEDVCTCDTAETGRSRPLSTRPLRCSHTHAQRADNTTSCDAFLCDVKVAAPGLRGPAQDVWERERQRWRQQREQERESFIRVEEDKKSYFVVSTKARLEKIDFQCGHAVNRREKGGKKCPGQKVGKWLQIAGVLLPYNKSNSLLLLLPVFDGQPCPEWYPVCQGRGREAWLPITLRHVIRSHAGKPASQRFCVSCITAVFVPKMRFIVVRCVLIQDFSNPWIVLTRIWSARVHQFGIFFFKSKKKKKERRNMGRKWALYRLHCCFTVTIGELPWKTIPAPVLAEQWQTGPPLCRAERDRENHGTNVNTDIFLRPWRRITLSIGGTLG